jgi:propanol-preferring alcohol dehydrogenase
MKAMVLTQVRSLRETRRPLDLVDLPEPSPGPGEILVKVSRCGVCHTELDEIEGRTPPPRLPVVPGHQVVGRVAARGEGARRFQEGDRVGVGWIHGACGLCPHCLQGQENLCPRFAATGRDVHGGYAEFMVVSEAFACAIPGRFGDGEAAPLLCAGAIGFRSLRLAGLRDGGALGLTGFGASAHLVLQMAQHQCPGSRIFVFARSPRERDFAREMGAFWVGHTQDAPPQPLDAVIDTTPAWRPMAAALRCLAPGGRLVVNAIRKEGADQDALLGLDYARDLWMEKEVKSVANVARTDIAGCLELAARIPIRPEVEEFPLEEANRALLELKEGRIRGAKVLRIEGRGGPGRLRSVDSGNRTGRRLP